MPHAEGLEYLPADKLGECHSADSAHNLRQEHVVDVAVGPLSPGSEAQPRLAEHRPDRVIDSEVVELPCASPWPRKGVVLRQSARHVHEVLDPDGFGIGGELGDMPPD